MNQLTKICKECNKAKPVASFSKNQYGKNNRIIRRPICKECYSKKKSLDAKEKYKFEKENPKPKIGENFTCPVCERSFIREHQNDVVLDHSHIDGKIRGYLCSSCNTSIGKFQESTNILERAIRWLKGTLNF